MPSRFEWLKVFVATAGSVLFLLSGYVHTEADATPIFQASTDQDSDSDEATDTNFWPTPQTLLDELSSLAEFQDVYPIAVDIQQCLDYLNQQIPVGDRRGQELIQRLAHDNQQLKILASKFWQENRHQIEYARLASQLNRFTYRLDRRIILWDQVNSQQLAIGHLNRPNAIPINLAGHRRITFGQLDPAWSEYLLLGEVQSVFGSISPDQGHSQEMARRSLARIYSPTLTAEQSRYIHGVIDPQIIKFLKSQASQSVDFQQMLEDIERYEANPTGYNGYKVNSHYQNLFWSKETEDQAIAADLQTHYRNANFRLAVSEVLINRMLPHLPSVAEPFSERIMGAQVTGHNKISNHLHVELIPDPDKVHLQLGTQGLVDSKSVAQQSGFTIRNLSQARFQVFQRLAFGRDGIDSSEKPIAYSSANQRVVGLESKLDPIPVVGWIARRVAQNKIRSQAPETQRLVKTKVASTASNRMQEMVQAELVKFRQAAYTNLLQPLMAMDLDPEPLQMTTTDDRIVMRYRLAGRDQMAAHTARPRDDGPSLMSVQLHETCLNNAINRIELNGNTFNIDQLTAHLQDVLGIEPTPNREPSEKKAEFEFAKFDPIRIDFSEGQILITLNLNSLQIGDGKKLKKISLTAAYQPQPNGMRIALVQDNEGTRIRGHRLRFRERAAIGTVHNLIFKPDYQFDALPKQFAAKVGGPKVEISQLVISDGWASISINDIHPVATVDQTQPKRLGLAPRLLDRR